MIFVGCKYESVREKEREIEREQGETEILVAGRAVPASGIRRVDALML